MFLKDQFLVPYTIDFCLENSQAAERKRDELVKARESNPSKNICHQRREQRRRGPKKVGTLPWTINSLQLVVILYLTVHRTKFYHYKCTRSCPKSKFKLSKDKRQYCWRGPSIYNLRKRFTCSLPWSVSVCWRHDPSHLISFPHWPVKQLACWHSGRSFLDVVLEIVPKSIKNKDHALPAPARVHNPHPCQLSKSNWHSVFSQTPWQCDWLCTLLGIQHGIYL